MKRHEFTSLKNHFLLAYIMKTVQITIPKDMTLGEIFARYPKHVPWLADILLEYGIPCYGCHTNQSLTLQALMAKAELSREEKQEVLARLDNTIQFKATFQMIVTKAAVQKIKAAIKEQPDKQILRIHAERGGCCGNQYRFMLVHAAESNDVAYKYEGIMIAVDPASFSLVHGAKLDHIEGKQASGFQIVAPNQHAEKECSGSCSSGGCGGCS